MHGPWLHSGDKMKKEQRPSVIQDIKDGIEFLLKEPCSMERYVQTPKELEKENIQKQEMISNINKRLKVIYDK